MEGDEEANDENSDPNTQKTEVDYIGVDSLQQQKIEYLQSQLRSLENTVHNLQSEITQIKDSKLQLAINTNLCLNQMREMLFQTMHRS